MPEESDEDLEAGFMTRMCAARLDGRARPVVRYGRQHRSYGAAQVVRCGTRRTLKGRSAASIGQGHRVEDECKCVSMVCN